MQKFKLSNDLQLVRILSNAGIKENVHDLNNFSFSLRRLKVTEGRELKSRHCYTEPVIDRGLYLKAGLYGRTMWPDNNLTVSKTHKKKHFYL